MKAFASLTGKLKAVKVGEWAMLLIILGVAGSLIFSGGGNLLGTGGTAKENPTASDALEDRLARVLSSMEGVGRVEVVIFYNQTPQQTSGWFDVQSSAQTEGAEPVGVVVVAEGAGDLKVRLELCRAVETLLRLSGDCVEIFKMGPLMEEV